MNDAVTERAMAANLHAWEVRTSASWLVAADAWEEAGEMVAARMCREESTKGEGR